MQLYVPRRTRTASRFPLNRGKHGLQVVSSRAYHLIFREISTIEKLVRNRLISISIVRVKLQFGSKLNAAGNLISLRYGS